MTRAYRFLSPIVLLSAVCSGAPPPALAQGNLNVYCSVQAEWCQAVANEFQRQTGIRVGLTLKGSGETLAQVTAEAANPKGDVWFGGTGDPHLGVLSGTVSQAAYLGSRMEYSIDSEIGRLFVTSASVDAPLALGAPVALTLAGHGITLIGP